MILFVIAFAHFISCFDENWNPSLQNSNYQVLTNVLQEKLLNRPIATFKREFEEMNYLNVTNNVTISSWVYSLFGMAVSDANHVFAVSRASGGFSITALFSDTGACSFQPIPQVNCQKDSCRQVTSSHYFPDIVHFIGTNCNYVSKDRGKTWNRQPLSKTFYYYVYHPTNKAWILAFNLIPVPNSPTEFRFVPYISKDYGASFSVLSIPTPSGVAIADWCRAGLGGLPEDRICIIGADYYYYQTKDGGNNWEKPVAEQTGRFYVHDRYITLQVRTNGTHALYVSSDNGKSFHFPYLPLGVIVQDLVKSQWTEDDNGVLWLAVAQNRTQLVRGDDTEGNLYQSDADGDDFILMLKDLHGKENHWDYHIVKTIEGTIIANTMKKDSDPALITSTISFDNGNTWSPLNGPKVDANGNPYPCDSLKQNCYLHLFGVTTWLGDAEEVFMEFYSSDDAVGLIIGTGNVGSFLSTDKDNVNTYLSRDGGLTWDEIFKGSTAYNFGDHGSLIVLAKNRVQTNEIYFSWNSGQNFSVVNLPEEITIIDIVTVSAQSEQFIVIGAKNRYRSYWGLDFSKLHARDCVAEDYEEWTQSARCILGHNIYWRRRKKTSECFTEDGVNHIIKVENCSCTVSDYECDSYYDRVVQSGKCVFHGDDALKDMIISERCAGQESYNASSGYRKIPGDTCEGNLAQYNSVIKKCPVIVGPELPGFLSFWAWVGIIVFAFFALATISLIAGFCIGIRDERFRKVFPWVNQAPAWVTAGYSNTLIEEVVTGEEFNDKSNSDSGSDRDFDISSIEDEST